MNYYRICWIVNPRAPTTLTIKGVYFFIIFFRAHIHTRTLAGSPDLHDGVFGIAHAP
jgi:hypothetical protein